MDTVKQRLDVLQELLSCIGGISIWRLDNQMKLLSSNCNYDVLVHKILIENEFARQVDLTKVSPKQPILLADRMTLTWVILPFINEGQPQLSTEGQSLTEFYVMGPVFCSSLSNQFLTNHVNRVGLTSYEKKIFLDYLKSLPIIQYSFFLKYGAMLYWCLHNEHRDLENIMISPASIRNRLKAVHSHHVSVHGSYRLEALTLRAVETGDISYQFSGIAHIGPMTVDDPLRQAKNESIIFIALVERAAIRGGLDEDISYSIGDSYIQWVEKSNDVIEVRQLAIDLMQLLIQQVYELNLAAGRSIEIQKCISYINNHLSEKIDFNEMAQTLRYSRNYLCAKFKKEIGQTLGVYILEQRVEMAKILLRTTDKSILEISQELQFSSSSHMGIVFKENTGMTPGAYREKRVLTPEFSASEC